MSHDYYKAHPEARVIDAAQVAHQRHVNRNNGERIEVGWVPGLSWEADLYAIYILDHGSEVNVFVREVKSNHGK